jgi:hypothetical protein
MTLDPKLVDELLAGYKKPEDIIGENGLLKQLTKDYASHCTSSIRCDTTLVTSRWDNLTPCAFRGIQKGKSSPQSPGAFIRTALN